MKADLPLSMKTFQNGILDMESVFKIKNPLSDRALKLYFDHLRILNDKQFANIVDNIIDEETFFPTIAVFMRHPVMESVQERIRVANQPSIESLTS